MLTRIVSSGPAAAVASLLLQATTSFLLLLLMAHILEANAYTKFSLAITTGQFVSALAYEWVRLATLRFFPGPDDGLDARRLATLRLAAWSSTCAVPVIVIGAGYLIDGDLSLWVEVAAIAALQGLSDFRQTVLRCAGHFLAFAAAQAIRSLLLFACSLLAVLITQEASAALIGLIFGYALSAAIGRCSAPHVRVGSIYGVAKEDLVRVAKYGMPLTLASLLHYGTSLAWRWLTIVSLGRQAAEAAAFSLALDIFQKPFPLLGTMIGTIVTPSLVRAYDRGTRNEQSLWLGSTATLYLSLSSVGACALIVLAPALARWIVPEPYQQFFIYIAPSVVLYFALLLNLQSTAALVPQLRKETGFCVLLSASQFFGGISLAWSMLSYNEGVRMTAVGLSLVTATLVFVGAYYARQELPALRGYPLVCAVLTVTVLVLAASLLSKLPYNESSLPLAVMLIVGLFCLAYLRYLRGLFDSSVGRRV